MYDFKCFGSQVFPSVPSEDEKPAFFPPHQLDVADNLILPFLSILNSI